MCLLVRTAVESEARPLFGSLCLFYVKMAERANSNDLDIPLKTLQSRRLLQGLIKQREIEFGCDISTGQYQYSSGLLR